MLLPTYTCQEALALGVTTAFAGRYNHEYHYPIYPYTDRRTPSSVCTISLVPDAMFYVQLAEWNPTGSVKWKPARYMIEGLSV